MEGATSLEGLAGIPKFIEMIRERSNEGFTSFVFWVVVLALLTGAFWVIATFGLFPIIIGASNVIGLSTDYLNTLTPHERYLLSTIFTFLSAVPLIYTLVHVALSILNTTKIAPEIRSILDKLKE